MAAEYPAATKTWTPRTDATDDVVAADINTAYEEITAIETDLRKSIRSGAEAYAYENNGGAL